jgi:hypothetical protein
MNKNRANLRRISKSLRISKLLLIPSLLTPLALLTPKMVEAQGVKSLDCSDYTFVDLLVRVSGNSGDGASISVSCGGNTVNYCSAQVPDGGNFDECSKPFVRIDRFSGPLRCIERPYNGNSGNAEVSSGCRVHDP